MRPSKNVYGCVYRRLKLDLRPWGEFELSFYVSNLDSLLLFVLKNVNYSFLLFYPVKPNHLMKSVSYVIKL